MIEITAIEQLQEQLYYNINKLNFILFESESNQDSILYKQSLGELINKDLENQEIVVYSIIENKQTEGIFEKYKVEQTPFLIQINNFNQAKQAFQNLTPYQMYQQIVNLLNQQAQERQAAQKLYFQNLEEFKQTNALYFFDLDCLNNYDKLNAIKYLEFQNAPLQIIKRQRFNELNSNSLLAKLLIFFKKSYDDYRNAQILVLFKEQIITNHKELISFIPQQLENIKAINDTTEQNIKKYLAKGYIMLVREKSAEDEHLINTIQNELKKIKTHYFEIDLTYEIQSRQYLQYLNKNNKIEYPTLIFSQDKIQPIDNNNVHQLQSIIPQMKQFQDTQEQIKALIASDKIFVFVKGNPIQPFCKFSRTLMEFLNNKKVDYGAFDIMTDDNLRDELKVCSNWKTYPQVFINQSFQGGLDIILELEQLRELDKLLANENQLNSYNFIMKVNIKEFFFKYDFKDQYWNLNS